ncbi:holo-acyl-carrier-protein synthase [Gordonia bronchialis DSM 43247]|jgi:holo-[acyl-carrier protein] synthase|uniref:Holo-[acyl-carrier-protein] synthase n=1 Tax=Gordonia bronchialis (strain ATCC 25592 / DSM 43247 / BCRC 13721 / JCM 3198 / KCTC 3076 / NBRC 16047 / NCTC 10667) TaxID=526226 RepID=D0LAD5_GORB4|nr:holo-ACP synthase [Gordonia bronchialis]ACY21248.1 holo-acyl-carrier-protein synthase [Gordonia bronchialis DSM 43247]MCC3324032.1 holo-ACP synthase [Gordonia bronchialis]QGS25065.1 holo-ACP synthase [Gordonia bronchialis]UAK38659.1 holo-ACP synthase [Gordonia bronchialis]STQ64119.1 Holo-[acyl-carrier-protein] synthase [Gordonia bronchialis]
MSVLGIGIDIVSIPEFGEQLKQPGTTFGDRFTVGERRDSAAGTGEDARHLAARWAAKEAVVKAWSVSRFSRSPLLPLIRHSDIEVITDNWGRPAIRLAGEIGEILSEATVHVSLTHDGDTAAAVAILEGS